MNPVDQQTKRSLMALPLFVAMVGNPRRQRLLSDRFATRPPGPEKDQRGP